MSTRQYYIITVKTFSGNILKFNNVTEYDDIGSFTRFKDSKTGRIKRFPTINCEIEEVSGR